MNELKLENFFDSLIHTAITFTVLFFGWIVIALILGIDYTSGQHIILAAFFTALEPARTYVIHRWYLDKIFALSRKWASSVARRIEKLKR